MLTSPAHGRLQLAGQEKGTFGSRNSCGLLLQAGCFAGSGCGDGNGQAAEGGLHLAYNLPPSLKTFAALSMLLQDSSHPGCTNSGDWVTVGLH